MDSVISSTSIFLSLCGKFILPRVLISTGSSCPCSRQYALQSSSQQEDTRDALGILKSSTSKLEGVANTILDYLASKASFSNKLEMAESLRTGLVTEIYQEDAGLESNMAHLIPLKPERRRKLQDQILSSL